MKKIIAVIMTLLLIFGFPMQVKAEADFTFLVHNNVIQVGYTDIYHENPQDEPGKPKPAVPVNQNLELTINAGKYIGSNYEVYIINGAKEKVENVQVSGKITASTQQVFIGIPGTLMGGEYQVVVDIDGNVKNEKISILENVALQTTVSTNAVAKSGEKVENLINGLYLNWVSNSAPTVEKPQDFILDYGDAIMDVSSMQVFANYGNTHGVKKAEILYYDITAKEWQNVKNKEGKTIIDFNWVLNNGTREPCTIQFDKSYQTNRMMLRVIESNLGWGNSTVMSEIQTWGYQVGDTYDLKQDSISGKEGKENITNISVSLKNYTGNVNFELVNAKDLASLNPVVKYDVKMENGSLNYPFVIPTTIKIGEYRIVTKVKGSVDSSLLYNVTINDEKKFVDITKNIDVDTTMDTVDGNIKNIIDKNILTNWTGKIENDKRLLLRPKEYNQKSTNMIVSRVKVYADKDIKSIKVEARTNPIDKKKETVGTFIPKWKTDNKGNYFEINFETIAVSFEYLLFFEGTKENVTIYDVEVTGIYLYENLMSKATMYINGDQVPIQELADNNIGTAMESNQKVPVTMEFDFAPYTLTSDILMYTTNYPKGQGINKMELEFYENGKWQSQSSYTMDYQANNELREAKLLPFLEKKISKMRIKITDANTSWSKIVLMELNALGNLNIFAQSVADSIINIKQPILGQTKLDIPILHEDFKDQFIVSIASSSNEEVIGVDGVIKPSTKDQTVNVNFKISSKSGEDVGYTKVFSIFVPKVREDSHTLIVPNIDNDTIIKNSSMGWVQYIEGFECRLHNRLEDKFKSDLCTVDPADIDGYWKEMDALYAKGLPTNILYMRMPWSWYEPEEGKYAWNDPNSELSKLVKGAKERNLEIAFRVLINSASMKDQAAPEWFFQTNNNLHWVNNAYKVDTSKKDPYLDDPIFLEKFGNFVKAFGEEYNGEENNVSFIDAMGYGNWGETESQVVMLDYNKKDEAIDKILSMYNKAFPDVLLGAQYGGVGYKDALDNYGYIVRRDAFGSGYMTGQKTGMKEYFNKGVPIFAENCYHHFESMKNNWGSSTILENRNITLKKVISDAYELRANTLDARVLEDCKLWLENDALNNETLVKDFALNAGYRLAPLTMSIPNQIEVNKEIKIDHVWTNNGIGFLPNKNQHWNNKYKVAFALLDTKTNKVVYQYNESSNRVNPGEWLKEKGGYQYTSTFTIPDTIKAGDYKIATAIVNEKLANVPDINLAIRGTEKTVDGWYVMDNVTVTHGRYDITLEPTVNGVVTVDSKTVEKYQDVKITCIPDEGYEMDKMVINGKEVETIDNAYVIKNITRDMVVKVSFKKKVVTENKTILEDKVLWSKDKKIVVLGKLPIDIQLVTKNYTTNQIKELIEKINQHNPEFLKTATIEKVVDIQLLLQGQKYNFDGKIDIMLELEEYLKTKNLGIIYIDDQGKIEKINSVRDNINISFNVSHLSTYAIVSYHTNEDIGVSIPGEIQMPKTGDIMNSIPYITMMLAVSALYILIKKKQATPILK